MKSKTYIKPALLLLALLLLTYFAPQKPIDPWNLLNPKKIVKLIFALTFVQELGSLLFHLLGAKAGAILSGLLGGLVSSTATTASLARRSIKSNEQESRADLLIFLAATLAMLLEALAITIYGTSEIHWKLFILFSGPITLSILMIAYQANKTNSHKLSLPNTSSKILPILKLAGFILAILTISKLLQNIFGNAGLMVLTFIVSLFEIHGSVIANIQLHDNGIISVSLLGALLSLSIIASYTSKLFLIFTLGSPYLKKSAVRATILLFLSLALSGFVFYCF